MSRPTHVMVAEPFHCGTCSGTGIVLHGFKVGPRGPICPDCDGIPMRQRFVTLEDFARLFVASPHGYKLRVAPNESDAQEKP